MKLPTSLSRQVPLPNSPEPSQGELYRRFLANGAGDLHKWHHYFDIYEWHFERFRGIGPRFLEIGVQRGGSLKLWRDYFGPEAHIVGIDIDPACLDLDGQAGVVMIGDQSDPDFLAEVVRMHGPFDIVLDDGGHMALQQITSFTYLYPAMSERGVYLCEDTHTSLWESFRDHPGGYSFLDLALEAARSLTDVHAEEGRMERFSMPPEERPRQIETSYLDATTRAVCFYDSIIVFERAPKVEPLNEVR